MKQQQPNRRSTSFLSPGESFKDNPPVSKLKQKTVTNNNEENRIKDQNRQISKIMSTTEEFCFLKVNIKTVEFNFDESLIVNRRKIEREFFGANNEDEAKINGFINIKVIDSTKLKEKNKNQQRKQTQEMSYFLNFDQSSPQKNGERKEEHSASLDSPNKDRNDSFNLSPTKSFIKNTIFVWNDLLRFKSEENQQMYKQIYERKAEDKVLNLEKYGKEGTNEGANVNSSNLRQTHKAPNQKMSPLNTSSIGYTTTNLTGENIFINPSTNTHGTYVFEASNKADIEIDITEQLTFQQKLEHQSQSQNYQVLYRNNHFLAKFPIEQFLTLPYTKHVVTLKLLHKLTPEQRKNYIKKVTVMAELEIFCVPQDWGKLTIHKAMVKMHKPTLVKENSQSSSDDQIKDNEYRRIDMRLLFELGNQDQIIGPLKEKRQNRHYLTQVVKHLTKVKHVENGESPTWHEEVEFIVNSKNKYLSIKIEKMKDGQPELDYVLGSKSLNLLNEGYLIEAQQDREKDITILLKGKPIGELKIFYKFEIATNPTKLHFNQDDHYKDSSFMDGHFDF